MLDEYLIGKHLRDSPECQVPIINFVESNYRAGGAANVALNLKALDLNPILLSAVGQDLEATILKNLLTRAKINSTWLQFESRPTTLKQRVVNEEYKQFLRIDRETDHDLDHSMEQKFLTRFRDLLSTQTIDGLILQDYNKGLLTAQVIQAIQVEAYSKKIPLFVDPKGDNFLALSHCTLFKPNIKELSFILGKTIAPKVDSIHAALKELELQSEIICVTLGDKGIYFEKPKTQEIGLVEVEAISNADVSGAGDSVIATLVWAYFEGFSIQEMLEYANRAGKYVCSKAGITIVNKSMLLKADN